MTTTQLKSVTKALAKAYTSTRNVQTTTQGARQEVTSYSLHTSDLAAIMRDVLAREFPSVKFYVRSHSYAGGSSIDVYYDGKAPNAPTREMVRNLVHSYGTGGFDGMIDMAYSKYRWLCADGKVRGLVTGGTEDCRGVHSAHADLQPDPTAVLMTGGTDYVFEHDDLPYDVREKMQRQAA